MRLGGIARLWGSQASHFERGNLLGRACLGTFWAANLELKNEGSSPDCRTAPKNRCLCGGRPPVSAELSDEDGSGG